PYVDLEKAETGTDKDILNEADRKIRAFVAEPGAWTILPNGKRVKLLGAERQDGCLRLTRVQFDGERPRSWSGRLTA
ncbi:MAG TPA: hypothetical protein VMC43_01010, partial [Candidatus Paceibacterota bacterium]|nr:hypothetical protein [Candidatus Paceibacterota bacterium]